ncbi:MAG TPA: site-specific DNA-methyltransferase [Candidatus Bipolaricaulota bacterium]|nr:site-specific DNA-methyltransferase [Candidatus Bipolaricaulota bacterium]
MPTLNWIGKDAVINHDKEVPFRLLKKVKSASVGNSQNLILHGDNLHALKALMPYYTGKIECIYIDPPYNTGSEKWVYNDKVNSPKIRRWLKKIVDRDDLCKHDKWLCMLYPRLKLLKDLLSQDGIIFISIDDNEFAQLKLLCDEIFGESNFISMLSIENNPKGRKNSAFISVSNEYCLIYAKDKNISYFVENIPKGAKDLALDENGVYVHNSGKRVLVGENKFNPVVENFESSKHYSVYYNKSKNEIITVKERSIHDKNTDLLNKGYKRYYSYFEDKFVLNTYTASKIKQLFENDALDFKNGKIYEKNFSTKIRIKSLVTNSKYVAVIDNEKKEYQIDVKTTSAGTELKNLFGAKKIPFDNPKNIGLIKLLVTLFERKDITILDSFAGSGTTGHAVLDLNKEDEGNRKFILVEMEDNVAKDITAERVKRAIKKYDYKDGFEYCELSKPLFDEEGQIEDTCDFDQFATYIYFTETQTNIDPANVSGNFIGEYAETEYYLIYKEKGENVLSKSFLKKLRKTDGTKIIYADKCLLDEATLESHNIIFKQIPYEVKVY